MLVDSEPITHEVCAATLTELGASISPDEPFERLLGHSMQHCLRLIEQLLGHPPPPTFESEYQARVTRALAERLQPTPGIHDALRRLKTQHCVASNGRASQSATLAATGLLEPFEGRLFGASDVARAKPAPDVFLLTASSPRVPPERCVVVEDTHVGITAAVAAGMTALGYAQHTPAQRLKDAGATLVFSDMNRLADRVLGRATRVARVDQRARARMDHAQVGACRAGGRLPRGWKRAAQVGACRAGGRLPRTRDEPAKGSWCCSGKRAGAFAFAAEGERLSGSRVPFECDSVQQLGRRGANGSWFARA